MPPTCRPLEGIRTASREWIKSDRAVDDLVHTGGRLADAEKLRDRQGLEGYLGADDWTYIEACRARDDAERNEELRKARELADEKTRVAEAAEKLATEQTRSAQQSKRFARRTLVALTAVGLLLVSAVFGFIQAQKASAEAEAQRQSAENAERRAKAERDASQKASAEAEAQRQSAENAERRAKVERDAAQKASAEAEAQRQSAENAERRAKVERDAALVSQSRFHSPGGAE